MKTNRIYRLTAIITALALALFAGGVLAEGYTATTMRLLHYEGAVEIQDAAGKPRFIMENVRFDSGEAVVTGADGIASIGLDDSKILTMDVDSRVEFLKQSNAMKLTLVEGGLFLDVQEKLDANASLDIQTSNLTVGIRGTIVFLYDAPTGNPADASERRTTLGVLEGTAQVSYVDQSGAARTLPVPAGSQAVLTGNEGGTVGTIAVAQMTRADLNGFVEARLNDDVTLLGRVAEASPTLFSDGEAWHWDGPVTLVAQSASKLYDGLPLTRATDVLIYGLPESFAANVSAVGSQTDAGESANPVGAYALYNALGEDVTDHFTNIETVAGRLVVDPMPLTVWTGSAVKVYDGTPLTNDDTHLSGAPGYDETMPPWRNASFVTAATARNEQTLFGLCGAVWVHGTNPLTGETREIVLRAGYKLTVFLHDEANGGESIEFRVERVAEADLPEDVLRLYADNPDLLAQACLDTGWDMALIEKLIEQLPASDAPTVEKEGLEVARDEAEQLMLDCTNVRITIDTEITNYNGRALGSEEARYTGVAIDKSIQVVATGSRTEVGESVNTYSINWGGANPANYVISEELGKLIVLEAGAAGSSEGDPAQGDPDEDDPSVLIPPEDEETPVVYDDKVTLTAASASKVFDGAPLTASDVTVSGLPEGFTVSAVSAGSQTDAGAGSNSVSSFTILNADGRDVTAQFPNVSTESGTLTVEPLRLSCNLGGTTADYDGLPYSPNAVITYENGSHAGEIVEGTRGMTRVAPSASGTRAPSAPVQRFFSLFTGDRLALTITGGGNDAGTHELTGSFRCVSGSESNYAVSFTGTTYTVAPAALTIATPSASKPYDGTPLTSDAVTITGLAGNDQSAVTITATGSITDVGTADNTYVIDWGGVNPGNYTVTDDLGMLVVTENLTPITFTAGSDSKTYDGAPLACNAVEVAGLPAGFTAVATAAGEQTDAGDGVNAVADCQILDAGGNDVTVFFPNISAVNGTLTVTPAALTVATPSASKPYDGTPLTSDAVTVTGLAGSDQSAVTVTANGSITDAGTADNTYAINWGSTNSANYTITEELGSLTVTPLGVTFDMGGWVDVYDREPKVPKTAAGTYATGGSVTLKNDEIIFIGGYWTQPARALSTFELVGGAEIRLTADLTAMNSSYECAANAGTYELPCSYEFLSGGDGNFTVSFTNTAITVTPCPVELVVDGGSVVYDGAFHTGKLVSATHDGGAPCSIYDWGTYYNVYPFGNDGIKVTVTGGGADVGDYAVSCTYEQHPSSGCIAGNLSISVTDGSLTVTANDTPITFTAGSAGKVYDGTPLTGEVSVSGLPGGLSFEAEATSLTDAGSAESAVTSFRILDAGNNDVTANFTNITTVSGTLMIDPAALTIATPSASKPYDGTPLTSDAVTVTGLAGSDQSAVTVTATGTITDVGTAENAYAVDWGGVNPGNYIITDDLGTLEVTKNDTPITITSGSASAVYTPFGLKNSDYTVDGLPAGLDPDVTISGEQSVAGTSDNTIAGYAFYDANGEDKAENFTNVTLVPGTLTVTRAKIRVWSYCGESWFTSSETYPYRGGGYPVGVAWQGVYASDNPTPYDLTISEKYGGGWTGKDLGTYTLTFSAALSRADLMDKYEIGEVTFGTVTIVPATLTITTPSLMKAYDGTPLTGGEATVEGLAGPDEITVTATGSQTDIGVSQNTYAIDWGATNSANYVVEEHLGTLEVTPGMPLVITTPSLSKVYDGEALTGGEATVEGLALEDAITVSCVASITDAGSVTNTYAINWGTTNSENYTIKENLGTLEITPATLIIHTGYASKEFDGTPLTCDYVDVEGLAPGDSIVVTATGVATEVNVWVENTYTIDWGTTNPANYIIEEDLGMLGIVYESSTEDPLIDWIDCW